MGPGSAAHHAAKGGALRCVRGTLERASALLFQEEVTMFERIKGAL
jgi:hypothetical protein